MNTAHFKSQFAIAPMMGWTGAHFRLWMRLLFPSIDIYTEMVTSQAIVYGDAQALLFDHDPSSTVLQIGGSDPNICRQAAITAHEMGYRHININVGCPSERVKSGLMGACLMMHPDIVAQCVQSMSYKDMTVSVKCRIGVDDQDDFEFLKNFIKTINNIGCQHFIIHARKAWLNGLSPKENRSIPPLDYQRVIDLKSEFKDCAIGINGGIRSADISGDLLKSVDQVMYGRLAIERQGDLLGIANELGFLTDDPQAAFLNYIDYANRNIAGRKSSYYYYQPLMPMIHDVVGAKHLRCELAHCMKNNRPLSDETIKLLLNLVAMKTGQEEGLSS